MKLLQNKIGLSPTLNKSAFPLSVAILKVALKIKPDRRQRNQDFIYKLFNMATTIALYYTEELEKWNQQLASYLNEMFEMENKLAEVIQRNTIPGIAAMVEQKQEKLNTVLKKIHWLQNQFPKQVAALKTDNIFLDDTMINTETEKKQNELRQFLQRSEKEYIAAKHDCTNFLSDVFKKRKN